VVASRRTARVRRPRPDRGSWGARGAAGASSSWRRGAPLSLCTQRDSWLSRRTNNALNACLARDYGGATEGLGGRGLCLQLCLRAQQVARQQHRAPPGGQQAALRRHTAVHPRHGNAPGALPLPQPRTCACGQGRSELLLLKEGAAWGGSRI
jgi:hypothetical protein